MDPVLVSYTTMVLSGIAALGGVVSVIQNERSWSLLRTVHAEEAAKKNKGVPSSGVHPDVVGANELPVDSTDASSPTTKPNAAGDSPSCPSGPGKSEVPKHCVHPSVARWAGCQGCRHRPLSAGLPDHHAIAQLKEEKEHRMSTQSDEDAA